MTWLWWFGLSLVLGVIELLTVDLMFLMLAGGALAGGVAGAMGAPLWAQLMIAVIVAVLLLVLVRPMAVKRLRGRDDPETTTNIAAHVGRSASVLADVTDRAGRVKLAGEVWSARTEQPGVVLRVGTAVVVTRIDGATAVVAPQPVETPSEPYGPPGPGY
jgi:membrane protein implicated in regulation of membrane protease activity